MFILIVLLVFLWPAPIVNGTKQGYRALSFGRTIRDYIQFQPDDMSPFASSFTLCAWIKRTHIAGVSRLFHYLIIDQSYEIVMGVTGTYNIVSGHFLDMYYVFPKEIVWLHLCMSWAAGGTEKYYMNGVEEYSKSTPSRTLRLGGTICIGNTGNSEKFDRTVFGGELYKLNLFSEQLTSSQIKEIVDSGMCSAVEEKYETRQLKWEQILTKQRNGNVTEFYVTEECPYESQMAVLKKILQNTESRLNSSESDLKDVSISLNKTLSELTEIRDLLNETQVELREKETRLHETEAKLEKKNTELQESQSEVQEKENMLQETETELNGIKDDLETRLNEADIELKLTKKTLRNTKRKLYREIERRESSCEAL